MPIVHEHPLQLYASTILTLCKLYHLSSIATPRQRKSSVPGRHIYTSYDFDRSLQIASLAEARPFLDVRVLRCFYTHLDRASPQICVSVLRPDRLSWVTSMHVYQYLLPVGRWIGSPDKLSPVICPTSWLLCACGLLVQGSDSWVPSSCLILLLDYSSYCAAACRSRSSYSPGLSVDLRGFPGPLWFLVRTARHCTTALLPLCLTGARRIPSNSGRQMSATSPYEFHCLGLNLSGTSSWRHPVIITYAGSSSPTCCSRQQVYSFLLRSPLRRPQLSDRWRQEQKQQHHFLEFTVGFHPLQSMAAWYAGREFVGVHTCGAGIRFS